MEVLRTDPSVLALLSYCLMHDLKHAFTQPGDRAVATKLFRQLLQALAVAYESVSGWGPGARGVAEKSEVCACLNHAEKAAGCPVWRLLPLLLAGLWMAVSLSGAVRTPVWHPGWQRAWCADAPAPASVPVPVPVPHLLLLSPCRAVSCGCTGAGAVSVCLSSRQGRCHSGEHAPPRAAPAGALEVWHGPAAAATPAGGLVSVSHCMYTRYHVTYRHVTTPRSSACWQQSVGQASSSRAITARR